MQMIMQQGSEHAAATAEVNDNIEKRCAQFREEDFQYLELPHIFDRPHLLGEIFYDAVHFSYRANRVIAQEIFAYLQRPAHITENRVTNEEMQEIQEHAKRYLKDVTIKHHYSGEIEHFLEEVKKPCFKKGGNIGAIVMNCNPFTLGHRHLIETAAKMVDGLYIFVVQEDRSFFPFADRLSLVQQGVKGIEGGIHVVPSGKFIISSFSFSGYFAKSHAVAPADSTTDVAIFGSIIAPALGITHRFVGEEPNCLTTNEYNETMQFLLPALGVQMHVIPRKAESGTPISATTVRDCLQNRDFETISKLVPQTTLEYLKNFSGNGI